VVCYISSYSYLSDASFVYLSDASFVYLSDASFVVARRHLLDGFDAIWIDSLNGDSRETGKLTPAGEPDPSVFSTDFNREGIRLGTAIGLFVRRDGQAATLPVRYRDFWGARKREELLASLDDPGFAQSYAEVAPTPANRFSFRPQAVTADYASWPRLVDVAEVAPVQRPEREAQERFDIDRSGAARGAHASLSRRGSVVRDCPGLAKRPRRERWPVRP
jgi:hypothetical protein